MSKIIDPRVNDGRLIARETNFQPGINGNFDVSLFQTADGSSYTMEIFMKLQFFFVDGEPSATGFSGKDGHLWGVEEKKKFMKSWHKTIKDKWSDRWVGQLKDGKYLKLCIRFYIQEAGWLWDHFEIDVTKIPPGGFSTSSVDNSTFSADVNLDSEDLTPKSTGQLAVVHEFGHMIGLPDEYKASSPHYGDTDSIMNSGTHMKPRHFQHLINWANKRIKVEPVLWDAVDRPDSGTRMA